MHMLKGNKEVGEKKNILIVHNYYQISGGEDTVVKNESELLKKNGNDVFFYTRYNAEIKEMNIWQKILMGFTSIYNFKTYREIKRIICEKKIDVVHIHNTLSLISPSVYYAALKCKVPVVQTVHNFRMLCPGATLYRNGHICEECVEKGLGCSVIHGCYRNSKVETAVCAIALLIHRTTGIYSKINYICLTEFNKKQLLKINKKGKKQIVDPKKIFVKPNYVKKDESNINRQKYRQYIYVGRLDEQKGIDFLFETWRLMGEKASKLIVCGTGPMEKWCKNFVKEKAANIELVGVVDNDRARTMISESEALILPTRWYEGFPMTILEAYSVGTPVIGPDFGNVGDIIIEGVTGYKFYDMDSMIACINKVCKKELFYKILNIYNNYYSEQSNYEMLDKIYQQIGHEDII